jgi:hypothetical protein
MSHKPPDLRHLIIWGMPALILRASNRPLSNDMVRRTGRRLPPPNCICQSNQVPVKRLVIGQTVHARCLRAWSEGPMSSRNTFRVSARCRSNSHAAKHRMWTWNLSRPPPPSCSNSISNSFSSFVTGKPHTAHSAPTPGPPHVRVGETAGSFPCWTAARAFARSAGSSGRSDSRRGGRGRGKARCQREHDAGVRLTECSLVGRTKVAPLRSP